MVKSIKIGVFLCEFEDTTGNDKKNVAFYRNLFLGIGRETLNDYWSEISYGSVDLNGSAVNGWNLIRKTVSGFIQDVEAKYPEGQRRYGKIIQAILNNYDQADIDKYDFVITVFNGNVLDAGAQGGILANEDVANNHTFLSHEIGHLLGLGHSFDLSQRQAATWSQPGEYYNKFDIMSAMNVHSKNHTDYDWVGPRLCAPFVDKLGWMPKDRIFNFEFEPSSYGTKTIKLISMSHPEQPGILMAKIGSYTFEFRTKEGWDSAIPESAVLIHWINDGKPYLIASHSNINDQHWTEGEIWMDSNANKTNIFKSSFQVQVLDIDNENYCAEITVSYKAAKEVPIAHDPLWWLKNLPNTFKDTVLTVVSGEVELFENEKIKEVYQSLNNFAKLYLSKSVTARKADEKILEELKRIIPSTESKFK